MSQHEITHDTIVEEIHRTREQIAERFDGDLSAILEDARQRQAASGRPVRRSPPLSEDSKRDAKPGQQ